MNRYYILILINLIGLSILLITKNAIAQISQGLPLNTLQENNVTTIATCNPIPQESLSSLPSNKNLLKEEKDLNTSNQKNTNVDVSQSSIWWAAQQFDPFAGNLIQNWLTYPQKQQINLTVDWQLWTILDYFGRYRFVNQFGTVVRKYGYTLNVLNQKEQCLAIYKYNSTTKPPKWELYLEKLGRDSLEVEPSKNINQNQKI
jgi:hypothetical protein